MKRETLNSLRDIERSMESIADDISRSIQADECACLAFSMLVLAKAYSEVMNSDREKENK